MLLYCYLETSYIAKMPNSVNVLIQFDKQNRYIAMAYLSNCPTFLDPLSMSKVPPAFELQYGKQKIKISEHEITNNRVFYVDFQGGSKYLTITVGYDCKDQKFWTSIPEGRQEEAEQIGKLIANYIRSKNK